MALLVVRWNLKTPNLRVWMYRRKEWKETKTTLLFRVVYSKKLWVRTKVTGAQNCSRCSEWQFLWISCRWISHKQIQEQSAAFHKATATDILATANLWSRTDKVNSGGKQSLSQETGISCLQVLCVLSKVRYFSLEWGWDLFISNLFLTEESVFPQECSPCKMKSAWIQKVWTIGKITFIKYLFFVPFKTPSLPPSIIIKKLQLCVILTTVAWFLPKVPQVAKSVEICCSHTQLSQGSPS